MNVKTSPALAMPRLPIWMRTLCFLIACACYAYTTIGLAPPPNGGLIMEIQASDHFPDADKVGLELTVTNQSEFTFIMVSDMHEYLRVSLTGPDGLPVKPYPYPSIHNDNRTYHR